MADNHIHRTYGDTRTPLSAVLRDGHGNPIDVDALTIEFSATPHPTGSVFVDWTSTGVTKQPTQVFTASATTHRLTCNAHKLLENDQIIVSNSGGALPTNLAASTRYFLRDVTPNSFKVSLEPGGSVITLGSAGTGTNSLYLIGHVQYAWSGGTSGQAYRAAFRINASSAYDTFPGDETVLYVTLVGKP